MNKKLMTVLTLVTFSAVPLMAQIKDLSKNDIDKTNKGVRQQASFEVMETLANKSYDNINKFVIHALKQDIETNSENAEKYKNLLNNYTIFLNILQEKNLTVEHHINGIVETVLNEYGEQRIYIILDDMAKAINNLPTNEKKEFYNILIGKYNAFVFMNKAVNIAYLYNISKNAISYNAKRMGYKSAISESPMVKEKPYAGPIILNN